jgi:hypothetical protein
MSPPPPGIRKSIGETLCDAFMPLQPAVSAKKAAYAPDWKDFDFQFIVTD